MKVKKLTALISALALLLFLCACSQAEGTPSQNASQSPTASQPVSDEPVLDTDQPGETSSAPVEGTDEPTHSEGLSSAELKEIAIGLIGHPVSELYDAIGQPNFSDYAPACTVEGESYDDGELHYDGFVVYTERTATGETVYDVD